MSSCTRWASLLPLLYPTEELLPNRGAGRIRTAEWRKSVTRDCAFPVATFFPHPTILSLPVVLLRKVCIRLRGFKSLTQPLCIARVYYCYYPGFRFNLFQIWAWTNTAYVTGNDQCWARATFDCAGAKFFLFSQFSMITRICVLWNRTSKSLRIKLSLAGGQQAK